MVGIRPVEFTENYYKEMDELDAILYLGYHIKLLEEATETYTTREREDHMAFAEFHQVYYDTTKRELSATTFKISEAQRAHDNDLEAMLVEKQESLEDQLQMAEGHVIAYVEALIESEDRRTKINEYLGI